jgi:hypothetical protein
MAGPAISLAASLLGGRVLVPRGWDSAVPAPIPAVQWR